MIKLKNILNEEPLNEGPSTEEKELWYVGVRKQAKYRNVSLEQKYKTKLMSDMDLQRDVKRGKKIK